MPYSKKSIEILLKALPDIKPENILDFTLFPEGEPTRNYGEFVVGQTLNPQFEFHIEPFELFLLMVDESQAYALTWDWENHIYIYLGLFRRIEQRIKSNFERIEGESLSLINSLRKVRKSEPTFLIYQFVTFFIYYHELGHLHQNKLNININNLVVESNKFAPFGLFDQISHAKEIDADLFAANHYARHILLLWSSFDKEDRTKENLETTISVVVSALFILFNELSGGFQEFYSLNSTHPHAVIRVSYIVDAIIQITNNVSKLDGFSIDENKCLFQCLALSRYFLSDSGEDGLNNYLNQYKVNQDEIYEYVHAHMVPFSKTIPYLISNNY